MHIHTPIKLSCKPTLTEEETACQISQWLVPCAQSLGSQVFPNRGWGEKYLSIKWHQNFHYHIETQQFHSHRDREQALKPLGKGLSEKRLSRWSKSHPQVENCLANTIHVQERQYRLASHARPESLHKDSNGQMNLRL